MEKVPSTRFDYRRFTPAVRLPAFRQMTASFHEICAEGEPEGFRAGAFGHRVGDLVFSDLLDLQSQLRKDLPVVRRLSEMARVLIVSELAT
jgi:hypothetical protein